MKNPRLTGEVSAGIQIPSGGGPEFLVGPSLPLKSKIKSTLNRRADAGLHSVAERLSAQAYAPRCGGAT